MYKVISDVSRTKKLIINTIKIFSGNLGSKLLTFVMLPMYTSWLSPDDFGMAELISSFSVLLLPVFSLSIMESVFVLPKNRTKPVQSSFFTTGFIFVLSVFLISGLLLIAIGEIAILSNIKEYKWYVYIVCLTTFISSYLQQFSRGLGRIGVYSFAGLIQVLVSAILAFFLIPNAGFAGMVWTQIFSLLGVVIYISLSMKIWEYFSISLFSKKRLRAMLGLSVPVIPNALVFVLIGYINRPIINANLGADQLAVYSVAEKLPGILVMLTSMITYSWQITALEEYRKEDYSKYYSKFLLVGFSIILCTGLCILFMGEFVIVSFIDVEFHEAIDLLPFLLLSPPLSFLSSIVGVNFLVSKKTKYFFRTSAVGAIVVVFLNFLLIPLLGLNGTIISTVLSQFSIAVSRLVVARRIVRLESVLGLAIIYLFFAGCVLSYRPDATTTSFVLGTVLFVVMLILNRDNLHHLANRLIG